MDTSENNPHENQLPAGIKERVLLDAIATSGFPLQGLVAQELRDKYGVSEEWSFIDRDTEQLRSLDVFAWRSLEPHKHVHCRAALLVECKSSIHPYVFFQNAVHNSYHFPKCTGLKNVQVAKRGDSAISKYQECHPTKVLGLNESEFATTPIVCSAFTQAIAHGDKVNVSGSDPFNSIVMPLVKSVDHASSLYQISDAGRDGVLYPTLLLAVCVMDAPMIVVANPDDKQSISLTPWVRIFRQEARLNQHKEIRHAEYVIDFVHRGFMSEFFRIHVEKFLSAYRERLVESAGILLGGGRVPNLDSWTWRDVVAG